MFYNHMHFENYCIRIVVVFKTQVNITNVVLQANSKDVTQDSSVDKSRFRYFPATV